MIQKGFIYCVTCLKTGKLYFGQTIISIRNCRKVFQYSKGGIFIKEWNTIIDIKRELKLNGHTLRKRLQDGLPYRGYLWK